jgi:hypothetical protein
MNEGMWRHVPEGALSGLRPLCEESGPVHFFWGSFDLAVTFFSGRGAPLHPGGWSTAPTG